MITSFDDFNKLNEDESAGGAITTGSVGSGTAVGGGAEGSFTTAMGTSYSGGDSGSAFSTNSNVSGMGAIVSAQPSDIPGDVRGGTKGSGDIGQPIGTYTKGTIANKKRNKQKEKIKKITSKLDDLYKVKYIKENTLIKTTFESFLLESNSDAWDKGFKNTKTFVFYYNGKMYLQGCRNCNEVTPLDKDVKARQLIGNVYQSLCNCSICGEYVILDEHKASSLEWYLEHKKMVDDVSASRVRNGLHVNIYAEKIDSKLEPTEVVKCEPFVYKHIHGDKNIDTLYVYVGESHTDDLFDNPIHSSSVSCIYHIIIDLDKKALYYPYPKSEINDKPKPVADIFNKYIEMYTL